jgi:hypothetical protein
MVSDRSYLANLQFRQRRLVLQLVDTVQDPGRASAAEALSTTATKRRCRPRGIGKAMATPETPPTCPRSDFASKPVPATEGYVSGTVKAGSPDAVCQILIDIASSHTPVGCSLTNGGLTAMPNFVDGWNCWGNSSCNGGAIERIPEGGITPYCPEDGYGYTSFGGGIDQWGRVYPPHACANGHPGHITVNFDLGKYNECPLGNPISPALGVKC